ncbi:hypothetical protein BSR28_08740, partial [Boudabousia liubingyangii]
IRHRSVRPISAKHAQASRFLQQSPAPQVSTSAPHLSVRAKFFARYPQRRRPRCLAHGFDGVSGAFAGP